MGKYQARVAVDAICGGDAARRGATAPLSPRVIFTDPQVAAVGHTLASAQEAGIAARAVDRDTSGDRRRELPRPQRAGHARFVVDEERGVLVGATFVGPDVAELLHAATIAVVAEVPLDDAAARGPGVPDAQRGLARPGRERLTPVRIRTGRGFAHRIGWRDQQGER